MTITTNDTSPQHPTELARPSTDLFRQPATDLVEEEQHAEPDAGHAAMAALRSPFSGTPFSGTPVSAS